MGNIEYDDGVALIGRTYRNDDTCTILIIPKEFAKEMDIENSKVSMSMLDDFGGNRYFIVSKFYSEITIE